jgi:hypothetical protein
MSHGTITKTIRPKDTPRARTVLPPRIINFDDSSDEDSDDDDGVSANVESQLTDDSAIAMTDTSNLTTEEAEPEPVVQNGEDWFLVEELDDVEINGMVNPIKWRFVGHDDMYMEPGDDQGEKRCILDYFLAVMPQTSIRRILRETNDKLGQNKKAIMSHAELMRFFGVCILITRYDFDFRRDLWSTTTGSKYMAPVNLAATGMSRHRFDDIWGCLTFSIQPPNRPPGMSSASYRWLLVDDFVSDYNKHRQLRFRPSELVRISHALSTVYLTFSHRSV